MTCGRKLADGQYWHFCGETDMGQSWPVLCVECGGEYRLYEDNGKQNDLLLTNYNVHDHFKMYSVEELKKINASDRLPFAVCITNLDGSLNVGIIIRTACLLGAERVIVFGRRKYDARSCVGSHNYIPIERVDGFVNNRIADTDNAEIDPEKFQQVMQKWNYIPIFVETNGEPITNMSNFVAGNGTPCLVLGSESNGIPESILNLYAMHNSLSIPQLGVIRSFNVSAAASIAMWEMYKSL